MDLKVFSPLSVAYSNHIDRLIQSSCGFSCITKRSFWSLFKLAWFEALSTSNVRSVFAAAGIEPFDPLAVLDLIYYDTPQASSSDGELSTVTPVGVRALRRQIKTAKHTGEAFTKEMNLVVRAAEKLSIKNEILEHENAGLREALIQEQKRRKRGKKMGILSKEEPGQAVFASPTKIATIRAQKEAEEVQKAAAEEEKEREKEAKAKEKERKAQEAKERQEKKAEEVAERKAAREEAKEARKQQREASKQVREEEQGMMQRNKEAAAREKGDASTTKGAKGGESNQGHVRSGRNISLPARYKQ